MRPGSASAKRVSVAAGLGLVIAGLTAVPGSAYERPGTTRPVSVSIVTGDATITGNSLEPEISAKGRYVVFTSEAVDLVVGDGNLAPDVFRFDRKTGKIVMVSVSSSGLPGIDPLPNPLAPTRKGSFAPAVSADGRFVAFTSLATNLVSGDTNEVLDVFEHDMETGETWRVSVASDGTEGNARSGEANYGGGGGAAISADGRYVAFASQATNLLKGGVKPDQIYIHDNETGETRMVSIDNKGAEGFASGNTADGGSSCPSLDPSGRWVAFISTAENLIPPPQRSTDRSGPGVWTFLHDTRTGKTEVASLATDGDLNAFPWGLQCSTSVSKGGRFVGFTSTDPNIVPNDSTSSCIFYASVPVSGDVFVRDRKTERTERVSVTSAGEQELGSSASTSVAAISPDGRYVTFVGNAYLDPRVEGQPPPPVDQTGRPDEAKCATDTQSEAYIFDRRTGYVEAISLDTPHPAWVGRYDRFPDAASSADGRYSTYAISTDSDQLNVFLHDRGTALGIGGIDASGPGGDEDGQICVTPDLCIPPLGSAVVRDRVGDSTSPLGERGADIYGASIAYRPELDDVFIAEELERMPGLSPSQIGGAPELMYGVRFGVDGRHYEVRATSLLGGTFGLFRCRSSWMVCGKVRDLRGGYGTTGDRVVFSLPLESVGIRDGGKLSEVSAFSAIGSYALGPTKILDSVRVR